MLPALHAKGYNNVSPEFIASLETEGKGVDEVVAILLETDFRKSKATIPFFPDLQTTHTLTCDVVLQVTGVGNIALPLPRRNEETNSRTLQLVLTDGFTKAVGVEVVRIHALHPNMPPGFKLRYRGGRVVNGKILLSPENVTCLFGGVAHLLENWKANQSAQRGRALGQAQHAEGKGPPPFDLLAPQASTTIRGLDDGETPKSVVAALPSPLCLDPTPSQEQKVKQRTKGRGEKKMTTQTVIDNSTVEAAPEIRRTIEQPPLNRQVSLGQHRRTVSASETKVRVEVPAPSSSVVADVRKIDWYVSPARSNRDMVPSMATSQSGRGQKAGKETTNTALSTDSFIRGPALAHDQVEEAAVLSANVLLPRAPAPAPASTLDQDVAFPVLPAPQKTSLSREESFMKKTRAGRGERQSHTQVQSRAEGDTGGQGGLGLLDFLSKKSGRASKSSLPTNPGDGNSMWRCLQCTFDNHFALGICEICESPR